MVKRIILWETCAAYIGEGLNLSPHQNAVSMIAVGLGSPFSIEWIAKAPRRLETVHHAFVPPRTRHHLQASGPMAFLYLDAARRMSDFNQAPSLEAWNKLQTACLSAAPADVIFTAFDAAFSLIHARTDPHGSQDVLRILDANPDVYPSVQAAAQASGLSRSRFQTLFSKRFGMPYRRYRLWARMRKVIGRLEAGGNLTEAAFEAGFASSAHLSAAFKAMFGISPSGLLRHGVEFELVSAVRAGLSPDSNFVY